MEVRELTCIGCPLGCALTVTLKLGETDMEKITVAGNTCPRGEAYAKKEVTNPTRIVTSSVRVKNGIIAKVSVKQKVISQKKISLTVSRKSAK